MRWTETLYYFNVLPLIRRCNSSLSIANPIVATLHIYTKHNIILPFRRRL